MNDNFLPQGLRRVLMFSAVGHLVFFVALVGAGLARSQPKVQPQSFIVTKLVKLGKERPKHLLPRKAKPPPPPKPAPVKPTAKPSAPKTPTPKKESSTSTEPQRSLLDALKNMKSSTDEPEGHADGSADGEVTDLSLAILGNKFGTEVHRCLKRHYDIQGINKARAAGKSATVVVRVGPDGKFIDWKIEKASGLAAVDRAVQRAIKRCGSVNPPPEQIREQVKNDGIEIVFKPD